MITISTVPQRCVNNVHLRLSLIQLTEEKTENEEMQRQALNMKKKTSRVQSEMEDLKLLLEEEQSRNADLEKKQRR